MLLQTSNSSTAAAMQARAEQCGGGSYMPSNRGSLKQVPHAGNRCMRMFDTSNKFEMACVDTAWNLQANLVQMPDARFWYKCTNAAGDKAFAEEGELWTSCFSGGRVALKYLFNGSVRTAGDGDAVKVYKHCSSNAIILVRRPPSLCVIIHTREVDQTTHDVLLSCLQDPGIMRDVWQMQALNSISDITLRTILSAAKKDLVDNEHVTVEGKVFFIWQGVDVTTRPSTVLVHKNRNTRRRVEQNRGTSPEDRAEDRRVEPPKHVESRATQNVRMAKELLEMARAELLERDTTAATSSDPWPVRLPAAMKKPAAAMKKPAAAPAPVAEAATVAPRREKPAWDFLAGAPRSPPYN